MHRTRRLPQHPSAISKLTVTLFKAWSQRAAQSTGLTSITEAAACQAHMPHLRELAVIELQFGADSRADTCMAPLLLQLIRAPRLNVFEINYVSSQLAHTDLLAAMWPFRALRRVKIHADSRKGAVIRFCAPQTDSGVAFPALEHLTIKGGHVPETLYLAAGTAAGAAHTLTMLSIQHEKAVVPRAAPAATPVLVEEAARELWLQAGRCTQLRALDFNVLCWPFAGDAARSLAHNCAVAQSLSSLKLLTRLQLHACDAGVAPQACCVLHGAVLGSAAAQLTALQTLHVLGGCGGLLELLRPEALLAACAEVGLQELGLAAQGVALQHVAEAPPCLTSVTSLQLSRALCNADDGTEGGVDLLVVRYPLIQFALLDEAAGNDEVADGEADEEEANAEEANDQEA